jgi:hypothetical protein
VAAPRRGQKVLALEPLPKGDGPQTAAFCVNACKKYMAPGQVKMRVKVDVIGIGSSAYDALRRTKDVEAIAVDVSRASDDVEKYSNLRSQIYFGVGDFCHEGGALPPDPALRAELLAHTYVYDAQGRQKVVSKDDVKKKLERSPDRSDAVAVYRPRVATASGLISIAIRLPPVSWFAALSRRFARSFWRPSRPAERAVEVIAPGALALPPVPRLGPVIDRRESDATGLSDKHEGGAM